MVALSLGPLRRFVPPGFEFVDPRDGGRQALVQRGLVLCESAFVLFQGDDRRTQVLLHFGELCGLGPCVVEFAESLDQPRSRLFELFFDIGSFLLQLRQLRLDLFASLLLRRESRFVFGVALQALGLVRGLQLLGGLLVAQLELDHRVRVGRPRGCHLPVERLALGFESCLASRRFFFLGGELALHADELARQLILRGLQLVDSGRRALVALHQRVSLCDESVELGLDDRDLGGAVLLMRLQQRCVSSFEIRLLLGEAFVGAPFIPGRLDRELVQTFVELFDFVRALGRHRLGGVEAYAQLRRVVSFGIERRFRLGDLRVGLQDALVHRLVLGLERLDLVLEDLQPPGVVSDLLLGDDQVLFEYVFDIGELLEALARRDLLRVLLLEDPGDLVVEGSKLRLFGDQLTLQIDQLRLAPLELGLERAVLSLQFAALGLNEFPPVAHDPIARFEVLHVLPQERDQLVGAGGARFDRLGLIEPVPQQVVEPLRLPRFELEFGQRRGTEIGGTIRQLRLLHAVFEGHEVVGDDRNLAGVATGGLVVFTGRRREPGDLRDHVRQLDRLERVLVGVVRRFRVTLQRVRRDFLGGQQDRRGSKLLVSADAAAD